MEINLLEALFRQQSDSSYKAMARIKNFLLDDLRETNKPTSVTRMMDRHFTVDPNAHMFVVSFEFQPKAVTNSLALRQCNDFIGRKRMFFLNVFVVSAQLESLYICISLDYLMTLQDFFISGLPTGGNVNQTRSRASSLNVEKPASEQGMTEVNRLRVESKLPRPSIAIQKPVITPPSKGICFISIRKENSQSKF